MTVERIVDELEPRPGGIVIPGWVIDVGGRGAGRVAPSYSLGITDARQRLLQVLGQDQPRPRAVHRVDERARAEPRSRREMTVELRQTSGKRPPARSRRSSPPGGCVTPARCSSAWGGPAPRRSWPGWSTTPTWCSSTSRARSAPSHSTSRSRSATASWPRPPTSVVSRAGDVQLLDRPRAGRRRVPRRRAGRPLREPQLDRDRRLRPPEDAAAGGRRRARDRGELRRGDRDRARTPRARSSSSSTSARPSATATGRATRERLGFRGAGPTAVITDLGVLEPDPETRSSC